MNVKLMNEHRQMQASSHLPDVGAKALSWLFRIGFVG